MSGYNIRQIDFNHKNYGVVFLPKITKCFKAYSSILNLKVLENGNIIFATTNSGVRVVDGQDYSVLSNILPEQLTQRTASVLFSSDARVAVFVNNDTIEIMLLPTQVIIKTIKIPHEKIDIIGFDPTSTYIIIGTDRGRVLQYRFNSSQQLSRLCSFPYLLPDEKYSQKEKNYVSAFAFYKEKFACSGYGGAIYVFNLHSKDNTKVITRLRARAKIESLYFLDEKYLISGNSEGVVEIISLEDTSKIQRLNAPFLNIKNIVAMPNRDYILVSSNKDYISLINIKTLQVIENKYLIFDAKIDKVVQKDEESLLVVLKDATVVNVELVNLSSLRLLVEENKLYEAYKLLHKTPMLRGSKENSYLEECFANSLKKAIHYLIREDIDSAEEITKPLMKIPSKKAEVKLIYTALKHYKKFQLLFHEQKYSLVYSMSDRYPALKETREYKSVEKFWKKDFIEAQKQMRVNNIEAAKALLRDYVMVPSKRAIIKHILYQNKEFIDFLQAIEDREFSKLNEIVKENKNFTYLDNYQSLNREILESVNEAKELINVGNIDNAEIIIQRLEKITKYEKIAHKLREESQDIKKLFDAFNVDKLFLCYKLIDLNSSLKESDLGKLLQARWHDKMKSCEKYAIKGQIDELLSSLGELKQLPSRSSKVGELLRLAYRAKIAHEVKKNEYKDARKLILFYVNTFGFDIEIKSIISLYDKKSSYQFVLTPAQLRRKPRDFWLYANTQL